MYGLTYNFFGVKVSSCYCSHVILLSTSCSIIISIPVTADCFNLLGSICYICRNNPSKYGKLKVIQIHHVSWILLFILWYAEVILFVLFPTYIYKYVNELLVHFQEKCRELRTIINHFLLLLHLFLLFFCRS